MDDGSVLYSGGQSPSRPVFSLGSPSKLGRGAAATDIAFRTGAWLVHVCAVAVQ